MFNKVKKFWQVEEIFHDLKQVYCKFYMKFHT